MANKSLRQYLDEYGEGHRPRGTRLTHVVGVPLIAASLPILPFNPLLGDGHFGITLPIPGDDAPATAAAAAA
jgi:hypothetical protein